jgi:acetyl esterase/lipase
MQLLVHVYMDSIFALLLFGERMAKDPSDPIDETAFPELTPDARMRLLAIGRDWNRDINAHRQDVFRIYGPLLARAPAAKFLRDIHYGPHARQRLDIFGERSADGAARPVVMFIHGGAFTRGNKSFDGLIYDNVLHWFALRGFVGVNVEYRLAPEIRFPQGAEDVSAAVRWVEHEIDAYGGDPTRLFMIGHSAGGSHLLTYLTDPCMGAAPSPHIKAATIVSGRLDLDLHPENPNASSVAAYFDDDAETLSNASAIAHAHRLDRPILIAIAQHENRFLDIYGRRYADRVQQNGQTCHLVEVPDHNHTSIVAHINAGDNRFSNRVLDFFRSFSSSG